MTDPIGAAVLVHDVRVGTLWRLDDDENHEFRFDETWLEEVAALVGTLTPADAGAFVDRLTFAVWCGDGDAHWKNWGFVYVDRRTPRLAPAYDLVPTLLFPGLDPELALSLGGAGRFEHVTRSSFRGLARWLGWSEPALLQALDDAVTRIRTAFAQVRGGYTTSEASHLEEHLRRALRA